MQQYGRLLHPQPALTNCKSCRTQPHNAHKTHIYNLCMTKHSHLLYTSTYCSKQHNTNVISYNSYNGYVSSYNSYNGYVATYNSYNGYVKTYYSYNGYVSSHNSYNGYVTTYNSYNGNDTSYNSYNGNDTSYNSYNGNVAKLSTILDCTTVFQTGEIAC